MPDRPTPNHLFSIGARREEDNSSPRSKSPELETDQFPEAREIFASVRRMRYRSIAENVTQRNPGSLCRENLRQLRNTSQGSSLIRRY